MFDRTLSPSELLPKRKKRRNEGRKERSKESRKEVKKIEIDGRKL